MESDKAAIWFEDTSVFGRLPPRLAAAKLRALGDIDAAMEIEETLPSRGRLSRSRRELKPYEHTSHEYGFVPAGPAINDTVEIVNARTITADSSLKNSRIKVTLDSLRVSKYPGGGIHRILFDFYAQNQLPGQTEHVHFNQIYRVQEGQSAGV